MCDLFSRRGLRCHHGTSSAHHHAQLESRHLLDLSRSKALFDIAIELGSQSAEIRHVMQTVRRRGSKLAR